MPGSYAFLVRDKKYQAYKRIASFLFLINAVFFAFLAYTATDDLRRLSLPVIALVLLVYAIYHWKKKPRKEKSYFLAYALIAATWILATDFPFLAVAYLLLAWLQYRLENDLRFTFSETGVTVDRLFRSNYEWSVFHNIVLKDGLLTLDFRDNRIIQVEPDWEHFRQASDIKEYAATEREFNDFCKAQLTK